MRLSTPEFRAMQSLPRRLGQKYFELRFFKKMGLSIHGEDVMEIGCGSGYGAHLLDQLQPRSYIGMDAMPEQIELARSKYPRLTFIVQDATNLGLFDAASMDVIIVFGVLHHIPEWRKVVDEITRVLKAGGSLFLEEPRGLDIKIFDSLFRWAHPDSDFGLQTLETHLEKCRLSILKKQWTPLMTMYSIHKPELEVKSESDRALSVRVIAEESSIIQNDPFPGSTRDLNNHG